MKRGKLTVVCGPMYAGKTTYLMQEAQSGAVMFKPYLDDRYSKDCLATHDGAKLKSILISNDPAGVDVLLNNSKSYYTVGIDECQFLSDSFILAIQAIQGRGSSVICAGLDLDFLGQPFGIMPRLACLADKVIKLTALCSCGSRANRTFKKYNSMDIIDVGHSDKYEPKCSDCYYK